MSVLTESRVSIQIPFSLHNPEGEEHVHAHWGTPSHHGHLGAFVYYIDGSLCYGWDVTNGTNAYPQNTKLQSPFILMTKMQSAECSPVTLARQAQLFGAAALLLANDECRCNDSNCTAAYGPNCNPEPVVDLSNDGSAGDVSIPTFLIYKLRAEALIKELQTNNQPALVELAWGMPNKTMDAEKPKIEHHLWSTANDGLLDVITLQHFKTISTTLAPHGAHFTPKFSLVSGKRFGCDKQSETGPCDHLCTNNGRYCALNAYHLDGHSILNETVRRLCVWQEYGSKATTTGVATYWDYVIYHLEHCAQLYYSDQHCLHDAYKHAKIDEKVINQCMADSGGTTEDKENSFLEQQLLDQQRAGVVTTPSVLVDDHPLEEANSFMLFEGLCRRYWARNWTTTPEVCYKCANCANHIDCLTSGGKCDENSVPKGLIPDDGNDGGSKKKKKGHGWRFFWFFSFIGACFGGYVYVKKQQEAGEAGVLNSYFQLNSDEPIA